MLDSCIIDSAHGTPTRFTRRRDIFVFRCSDCGLIMADVEYRPQIYERESYYSMKFKSKEDIDKYWGFRWRHVLNTARRTVPMRSVLDVGAGNGYFVYVASSEFHMEATGLEISQAEIEFASRQLGVRLISQMLHEHDRRDYSAVSLFNVLEHVPDPLSLLRQARDHLAPGGVVLVTTPNPSCLRARAKGLKNWGMIDPPHHMNLFTKQGLKLALNQTGFAPAHYETLSTYMEWLWNIDTETHLYRRILFRGLRALDLGADHFFIAKKV